ncbi:hypothetical protein DIPPA_14752 [Diplonema papillatum]|nr:hypothetical protein DIPPA_14752 [Diplonema papillatum]
MTPLSCPSTPRPSTCTGSSSGTSTRPPSRCKAEPPARCGGESAFIRCRAASFLGEMLLVELSTTISSQFRTADEGEGPRPLGVSSLHALYNHLQAVVLSVERTSVGVLPASPLALILYVQAIILYLPRF